MRLDCLEYKLNAEIQLKLMELCGDHKANYSFAFY
ncbi:hypothetical protein ACJIZ3_009428 [Penstemon smallii]|uniref:Uncharacterized protein n=1 Tax=Penstemon smallii TaxID=265156 RepID=A0ABD3TCH2_9LAMI